MEDGVTVREGEKLCVPDSNCDCVCVVERCWLTDWEDEADCEEELVIDGDGVLQRDPETDCDADCEGEPDGVAGIVLLCELDLVMEAEVLGNCEGETELETDCEPV